MEDVGVLALVLGFVTQILTSIIGFATFYLRLKHDIHETLAQVTEQVQALKDLKDALVSVDTVKSPLVVEPRVQPTPTTSNYPNQK